MGYAVSRMCRFASPDLETLVFLDALVLRVDALEVRIGHHLAGNDHQSAHRHDTQRGLPSD
jgi:hypothetical protein